MIRVKVDTMKLPTDMSVDFYDVVGQIITDGCKTRMYENEIKPRTKKTSGATLIGRTSTLVKSIDYLVNGEEVAIGTNVEYAATHQYGDENRNIPARPFLELSNEMVKDIQAEIEEELSTPRSK